MSLEIIVLSVLAISNIVLVVALIWLLTRRPTLPATSDSSTTKPPTVKVKKSDELQPGLMRFEEDDVVRYLVKREVNDKRGRRDPHNDWKIYGASK